MVLVTVNLMVNVTTTNYVTKIAPEAFFYYSSDTYNEGGNSDNNGDHRDTSGDCYCLGGDSGGGYDCFGKRF